MFIPSPQQALSSRERCTNCPLDKMLDDPMTLPGTALSPLTVAF